MADFWCSFRHAYLVGTAITSPLFVAEFAHVGWWPEALLMAICGSSAGYSWGRTRG